MKQTIISASAIAVCLTVLFATTSFSTVSSSLFNASKTSVLNMSQPVTFSGTITSGDGTTYFGHFTATGAINATGNFVMPTKAMGTALHCLFILTLPEGTLTIRMNCNMTTGDGRWKILEGSGTYQNAKGQGSLIMPNDNDEILIGNISW